jgi:hypothetical protein
MKVFGVGLDGLTDFSPARIFADAMKTCRSYSADLASPWGAADTVPLDAAGNPLADFSTLVMIEQPEISGTYKLSFDGTATVSPVASDLKVLNQRVVNGKTSADVVVNSGGTLALKFTNTQNGVKNLKLIRPNHTESDVFTHEFLEALKPFNVIRLMDVLRTNDNEVTSWATRKKTTERQTGKRGMAYEYAFELARASGKDIWFNIPHQADDSFLMELAKMAKGLLPAERRIYLEYSNEVWNGIFKQSAWNVDQAVKDQAQGTGKLDYDGSTNKFYWGWRRVGSMAVRAAKAFSAEFGTAALNDRVRVILAMQIAYSDGFQYKQALNYIQAVYGDPKQYLFATSGAPYFGGGNKDLYKDPNLTVDMVIDSLSKSADNTVAINQKMKQLALGYGLKYISYEGGVDIGQIDNKVDVKIQAQLDPRIREIVYRYFKNVMANSDGMNYFVLCSKWSKNGYWGLMSKITGLLQPKYLGILDVRYELGDAAILEKPPGGVIIVPPPSSSASPASCNHPSKRGHFYP